MNPKNQFTIYKFIIRPNVHAGLDMAHWMKEHKPRDRYVKDPIQSLKCTVHNLPILVEDTIIITMILIKIVIYSGGKWLANQ